MRLFRSGYLTLGRWRGAPIKFHWSAPIGAVVFGSFGFAPAFWLGFLLLIVLHELGHAAVVRACRAQVLGIEITGLGGQCAWSGDVTAVQRACIAWGGVWAQLVLLVAALAYGWIAGPPQSAWAWQLEAVFTSTNLWLVAINLIPIAPLDGAEAWPLPRLLLHRYRQVRRTLATERSIEELRKLEALDRDAGATPEARAIADEVLSEAKRRVK